MDAIEFGQYLKSLRKAKGLTLIQLGESIGFSNPYLSQIENGHKGIPSPDLLKKLAPHLGTQYSELLFNAGYVSMDDVGGSDIMGEPLTIGVNGREYFAVEVDTFLQIKKMIYEHKNSLNELSVILESDQLTYKKQILTDLDRKRILIMLEQLFPDKQ